MRLAEFRNEPLRDFRGNPEHERRMKEALAEVKEELGREYDLVINGERIKTADKFRSLNPGQKDQTVGLVSKADAELAERAIRASQMKHSKPGAARRWKSASNWFSKPPASSASESTSTSPGFVTRWGRPGWRRMRTWPRRSTSGSFTPVKSAAWRRRRPLTSVHGERNFLCYLPLGVGVVIPPWNFPLAILAGMTLASIVAGNTVVLKPSSDSPVDRLQVLGSPRGSWNAPRRRELSPRPGRHAWETCSWATPERALWLSRVRKKWGCGLMSGRRRRRRVRSG